MAVKDTQAMIAGMRPALQPGRWHFATLGKGSAQAVRLMPSAHAMMQEPEGVSLLLSEDLARSEGLVSDVPMAQILLQVTSALDGVGLTAAVAAVLTEARIPCNVIAGALHDHVFVPVDMAERAVALLQARATEAVL